MRLFDGVVYHTVSRWRKIAITAFSRYLMNLAIQKGQPADLILIRLLLVA